VLVVNKQLSRFKEEQSGALSQETAFKDAPPTDKACLMESREREVKATSRFAPTRSAFLDEETGETTANAEAEVKADKMSEI